MSEGNRLHPVAALAKVIDIIKDNFITLLILLFVGGSGSDMAFVNLSWLLIMIVVLLIWGVLDWWRFSYRVVDGELQIHQGIFVHKKHYISNDRIQVIDLSAGVIQRLFGLVSVEVKTAGSRTKQGRLSAVTKPEAERLKRALKKDTVRSGEEEAVAGEEIYHLGLRELVIAASTSGRFGVSLSIVGTLFSQLDQFISDEEMVRLIETLLPASATISMVIAGILGVVVISWVLSFLGTLVMYANFNVTVRDGELIIARGLFERRQLTIPVDRIQALQVKEELMRQPFGYATLKLESAGYGDEGGVSTTLFPLLKTGEVAGFLRSVIPEFDCRVDALTPPGRARRRYIIRAMLIAAAGILVAWAVIPYGQYAWLLILPAGWLGWQQYRDAAVGTGDDTLIMRYRLLSRSTAIIRRYRVQATQVKSTPFQRMQNLLNFSVMVASGNKGQTFSVRELDSSTGLQFWDWVSSDDRKRSIEYEGTVRLPDLN